MAITNNGKQTLFEYDGWGNLAKVTYPDGKVELRNPDRIGNLYASADKKDRKYGAGGRLEEDAEHFYHYDDEGNLIYKELRQFQEGVVNYNRKEEEQELGIRFKSTGTGWRYDWQSNGMLARVIRPDEQAVHFRYDALGRCTRKMFRGTVTRWIWDGNVPLHEWEYKAKGLQQPPLAGDTKKPVEPADDVTTWVFEAGTFVPAAKLKGDKQYSIVTDYLGTPIQMYDEQGEKTWDCTLDVYGKVATFEGSSLRECPFRYQGQYEDEETGLYYNRFRYYSSESGSYLSQDPIGLAGGIRVYCYVSNTTCRLDILGLFHHNDTGHNVYGLYDVIGQDAMGNDILSDEPYYIGITNNPEVRESQHVQSKRLGDNSRMKVLDENVTYGQARGYEQAYIEHYGTKTGIISEDISEINRGNKINSFDIDNTTRARDRHQSFVDNRKSKLDELAPKGHH